MSQHEQHPPPHPATPCYPAPAYTAAPPKDLTTFGVLAFSTAALATTFDLVNATVVGRAARHVDAANQGDFDWSLAVYAIGTVLAALALLGGWITGSLWLFRARKNAEMFFALVMLVSLVLWGLVLRRITREQHDQMYGRAPA